MTARTAGYQWQAERYEAAADSGFVRPRIAALAFGLLVLVGLPAAAWFALAPATTVQMRFVADIAGPHGRAALAEAAMRLAAASMAATSLTGEALLVTVADRDAVAAQERAHSVSVAVLDMALSAANEPAKQQPASRYGDAAPITPSNLALVERARLQATLTAVDARLAGLSTALTGVARDLAAGMRVAPDRKPGRETLDKALVVLADLQLQRIQLQSRYQDDFPAVVVLDNQIRSVRTMIADETRKIDAATRPLADPGDPVLTAERERLRAEQSQVLDRRIATMAGLAALDRASTLDAKVEAAAPLQVHSVQPGPLLIEAATTVTRAPDVRWWAVPMTAASAVLLLLGARFVLRRSPRAIRAELILQQLEAMALTQDQAIPGQQIETLLRSHTAAYLLQSPRERTNILR